MTTFLVNLHSTWHFFATATVNFATDFLAQREITCRTGQNVEWLHLDQYWLRYVCFSPNSISTLNVRTFGTLYLCNPCNAYTSYAAAFLKTLVSNQLDVHKWCMYMKNTIGAHPICTLDMTIVDDHIFGEPTFYMEFLLFCHSQFHNRRFRSTRKII